MDRARAASQPPPEISASDTLLASRITLPPDPIIVYSLFTPSGSFPPAHENIELARRQVYIRNGAAPLLDSILTSLHIGKQACFYIFRIITRSQLEQATSTFLSLSFDGLMAIETAAFAPLDLYPCSDICANRQEPCPACINCFYSAPSVLATSQLSPAIHLPRKSHRNVYSHFLEAVRCRLIDDISEASKKIGSLGPRRHVRRLKGGFLLDSPPTPTDWGSGWEYRVSERPPVFCHLQIQLSQHSIDSPACLIIYPQLTSTSFNSLSRFTFIPIGTPIVLLPHGTPAYFLTKYTGPTSALTKQFQDSLLGLGVSQWQHDFATAPGPTHSPARRGYCHDARSKSADGPPYIIAWINVENKQGDEKGTTVIYPARLCLSYTPAHPLHPPLSYIPELPAQLQPSPLVSSSFLSSELPSTLPTMTSIPSMASHDAPSWPLSSSPTAVSLRAFRTLTVSRSNDIQHIAAEVGDYVDAVARERERERERLRRERESGLSVSPRLSRTTVNTPASVATPSGPETSAAPSAALTTPLIQPAAGSSQQPQSHTPGQNFYPSPPQTNPPVVNDAKTSPAADSFNAQVPEIADTPGLPPVAQGSTSSTPPQVPTVSYDPFGGMDAGWGQTSQSYMDMDMDMDFGGMDMGFSMNMNPMVGGAGEGGDYYNPRAGLDLEDAFTDDDFSFFDRPSDTPTAPSHLARGGSLVSPARLGAPVNLSGLGMSPPLFGDVHLSGPGPPQQQPTPYQHPSSPWVPHIDGPTPQAADHADSTIPPELLPPSPGQTPECHSAPATPGVHLATDPCPVIRRPSTTMSYHTNVFDPIPFASSHRDSDGKYAVGKFALPSPPDEEDRTEPLPAPNYTPGEGWRQRYNAATDPRIGVMRKLIGVKRKATFEHYPASPAWQRDMEEWFRGAAAPRSTNVHNEDDDDDAKSDDDDDDELDVTESPLVSRPSTPLPAYLPLGPTLLHTHFQHAPLLALSTPLRAPGAAVAPTNMATSAPASVPTPVSPAATMGAASEKSRSLEAAASILAREVVENGVWADAWRAGAGTRHSLPVSSVDVKIIERIFEAIPSLETPLDMATSFHLGNAGDTKIQRWDPPPVTVGKGDAVIQVLPSAFRFWEKLGLGPRGGRKDIVAFVLYEDDGANRMEQVESWVSGVAAAYKDKHLGTITLGANHNCPRNGLLPLRFDSTFRKTLASFFTSFVPPPSTAVFFIATPTPTMTLASPTLRQVFSAIKKALNAYPDASPLFQFIPEQLIVGSTENPSAHASNIDSLCYSVYNRILVPVSRLMSRTFTDDGKQVRSFFHDPAVTLARAHPTVSYERAPKASLGVVDRHTLLHIAYQLSPCGKWILAACVDQRGEAHDLGVWLTQTPGDGEHEVTISPEAFVVKRVWEFGLQFARNANIEWKMVFAKLGAMGEYELTAWMRHLASAVVTCMELPAFHVTLLSVEPNAPWVPLAKSSRPRHPTPPKHHHHHHTPPIQFTDVTAVTYALFPCSRLPTFLPPVPADMGLSLPFIPETPTTHVATPGSQPSTPASPADELDDTPDLPHPLPLLPRASATLVRVPPGAAPAMLHIHLLHAAHSPSMWAPKPIVAPDETRTLTEIAHNYHELAVLGQLRWGSEVDSGLPFHLAAVDAMRGALDRDVGNSDVGVE